MVGYGVLRFVAEFFREPDEFLGLLSLGMSMGQWLCVPMVLVGAWRVVVGRQTALNRREDWISSQIGFKSTSSGHSLLFKL